VWTIDSFVMGDGVSNLPTPEDPTIEFRQDGTVEVFTACKTGQGRYELEGDAISLSDLTYPGELACLPMTQGVHDNMLQVMVDGDITYEIDAARLWLTRGDYGLGGTTE
jgi:heat shock protein HslJ